MSVADKLNRYFQITKRDDEQRMVYGYCSTESVDSQGETVTKDAMAAAWDDYMQFANVREMHGNSAAGIVKEYDFDDNGVFIGVKVVDNNAWNKVVEGVYKGFSIGGKKLKDGYDAITKTITGLKLTEISLVDRPSNPDALITVWKADDATPEVDPVNELADMLRKGEIDAARLLELAKADKKDDGKEHKYGNVEYADTKNDKYPIDTEKHIRAAWSYINMPKNQKGYTDKEVESIKANIVAAWKDKIDKDGPPSADDENAEKFAHSEIRKGLHLIFTPASDDVTKRADDVKKGMYAVANLASLLTSLQCIQQDCAWEAGIEGDDSNLPKQLADLCQQMAECLVAMAQEESDELVQALKLGDGTPAVEIIDTAIAQSAYATDLRKFQDVLDVLKAGQRNSAADQDRLQQAHDLLSELGAKCDDGEDGKGAGGDDAQKVAKAHNHDHGDIAKMQGAFEKMAGEVATLRKAFDAEKLDHATLRKAHDELVVKFNAQPAPPKGAVSHTVIAKGEEIDDADLALGTVAVEPVRKADGTVDEVATQIKQIQQGGGIPFHR